MRRPISALAAATAAALLATAGCSAPQHVEVPPPDAGPVDVVRAYTAAINAHDRDALAALSEGGSVPETWLGVRVDLVDVGEPVHDTGLGTAHAGEDVVTVPVQAVFHHTDGSLPDDEQTGWSYLLVRQDERWVVFSQGVG